MAYFKMCEGGLPEADRPKRCCACNSKRTPHRHGTFIRVLLTLTEAIPLTIFRFLCPDCRTTCSVLPAFAQPHHQAGAEVKEAIMVASEEGTSLSKLAETSRTFAGGGYTEKTLRRWRKDWLKRREAHEPALWAMMIQSGMDAALPRERQSAWKALQAAWQQAFHPDSLFTGLLRLGRLSRMAVSS
jgi:hypothetical protein